MNCEFRISTTWLLPTARLVSGGTDPLHVRPPNDARTTGAADEGYDVCNRGSVFPVLPPPPDRAARPVLPTSGASNSGLGWKGSMSRTAIDRPRADGRRTRI